AIRRAVLDALIGVDQPTETPVIAEQLGYPTGTSRRALEDLTAHGIVHRIRPAKGEKNVDRWKLTEWADEHYQACVPEKSSNTRSERYKGFAAETSPPDFSGTPDGGDAA